MGERTHHRIGREASERAQRAELHGVAEIFEDRAANLAVLEDLCHTMKFGSLCALGGFTPYPVISALTHFPEDFGASPKRLEAAE